MLMLCKMEPQKHINAIHSSPNMWVHVRTHTQCLHYSKSVSGRQSSIVVKGLDSGDRLPKFKSHFSHLLFI